MNGNEELIKISDEMYAKGQSIGYLDENGEFVKVSDAVVDIEDENDWTGIQFTTDSKISKEVKPSDIVTIGRQIGFYDQTGSFIVCIEKDYDSEHGYALDAGDFATIYEIKRNHGLKPNF